ncbi:hypothetical protein [Kineococcus sp. SYSU DK005]|uniref:hypothetical protein n=1 Tax=Kineococcus sp. SYSU DK005 TaxID=3383126 RepID=UPI003D7D81BF
MSTRSRTRTARPATAPTSVADLAVTFIVFLVVATVLTVALGHLFGNYLLGAGPGLLVALGVAGAGALARRRG